MADIADLTVSAGWEGADAERGLDRLGQKFDRVVGKVRDTETVLRGAGREAFGGALQAVEDLERRIPLIGQPMAAVTRQIVGNFGQVRGAGKEAFAEVQRDAARMVENARAGVASLRKDLEAVAGRQALKKSDFLENQNLKFGGKLDADLLNSFRAAETDAARLKLLIGRFGEDAQKAFQPVERAALSFSRLERDGAAALGKVEQKLTSAAADAAKLESGVAQLTSEFGQGAGAASTFGGAVGITLVALLALAAGAAVAAVGVFEVAKRASDAGSLIHDMGEKTGLSAELLSVLQVQAEQSGSSLETAAAGAAKFSKSLVEAAQNLKGPVAAALSKFGIDAATAYREPEAALIQFIRRFNELPDSAAKNRLEMVLFKDRAGELIPVIKSFGTDVDGLKRKLADLGLVWTQDGAAKADEFGDALTEVQQAARGLANTFGREVMPEITRDLKDLTSYVAQNRDTFRAWGTAVGDILRGARAVMDSEAGVIVSWLARIAALTSPIIQLVNATRQLGAEARAGGADPSLDPYGPGGAMRGGKSATRDGNVAPTAPAAGVGAEDLLIPKATRSGGASAVQRAARLALESAQIDLRGAESVYQEGLSIARRALDLNLGDFKDYLQSRRELEGERYKSAVDAFGAERTAASGLKVGEREVKLKDIHQREQAAEREHNERMAQISTDGLLHDLEVRQKFGEAGVRQMLERQKVADADLARLVAAGTKTNEQAVSERFAALSKVAEAEGGVLQTALLKALGGETFFKSLGGDGAAQLKETISEVINNAVNAGDAQGFVDGYKQIFDKAANKEEARAALDAIVEFFLKRKQAYQQANSETRDARDTDITDAQEYTRRLSGVSQVIEDMERESQADRLRILEQAGVRREEVWKRQLAFDQEGERIASQRRIAELQLQRDAYEKESKYEAHRAELIAGIDRQIEAERARSGQRQNNIFEEYYAKQNEKLKSIAERGVSAIRDALQGLRENGFKGFFRSLAEDFRDVLLQWSEDLLKSQFLKVLRSIYKVPAPGSTQGAGGAGQRQQPGGDFLDFFKQALHIGQSGSGDADAVSAAGDAMKGAIEQGGQTAAQKTTEAGERQAISIRGVGVSIVGALAAIGSQIAAGAGRGNFWAGLALAAVSGAISGAVGALMKGGDGSGSGGAGPGSGLGSTGLSDFNPGGLDGAAAAGGFFSAKPGGRFIQVAEGGYDELVLTTDPRHRGRMADMLAAYVGMTGVRPRGYAGAFASGGFASGYVPPVRAGSGGTGARDSAHYTINVTVPPGEQTPAQARKTGRQIARATRGALAQY